LDMRLTEKGAELFARLTPIADAYQAELLASLGANAEGFRTALAALQGDLK
jgi:DNA-binding MarR family transcriptional regulator